MYLINSIFISLDMMIMVLISIAYLTLLERKVLGYIQLRKGPNKVGIMGLLQPFSDAIKLFSKENFVILKSNYYFYLLSPMFMMLLMLLLWNNMPMISELMNMYFSMLMILSLMSMGVYGLMIAGWSSNSMYTLIGSLRSIAQTISYEVSMIILLLSVLVSMESFNLMNLMFYQKYLYNMFYFFMLMVILMVSFLAELNRTPFDFAEGESELVSGFNIEYMSGSFALIFIAEYGMIMLMMFLFTMLFMGGNLMKFMFYFNYLFMLFFIIWIRGTFPRFRYDNLMYLTWMSYLPISLNYLLFMISIKWMMLL
uniref:NADH-ubiquinone oxidoreductase chain 1 n=1 Tax=Anisopteromalus calandrae TaxID=76800 RepID=A0A8E5J722_9HYME|nr:NADH dehydrogenase subunit 1 [Anisopteromalus calandrae]QUX32897.1 NADH dehydrogenase subunit 1 [Anisopteromalus calandrae]